MVYQAEAVPEVIAEEKKRDRKLYTKNETR